MAKKGGPPMPLTPSLATADAGKVTKYSILPSILSCARNELSSKLKGPWWGEGHHRPMHFGVLYKESGPLLKCSWNRLFQTRGRDPSPEGARNRSEEMME